MNFRSREETLSSSSSLVMEDVLSALLVVVEGIMGATALSIFASFVDLLSGKHMKKELI